MHALTFGNLCSIGMADGGGVFFDFLPLDNFLTAGELDLRPLTVAASDGVVGWENIRT